jgi:peptidoglycan/LPS O-acetylase OafA/YrhL
MVIFLHPGGILAIGGYAVFGFYILSGYLMTLIMQKNYGYSRGGVARYAVNRFLRIYLLFRLHPCRSLPVPSYFITGTNS